MNKIIAKLKKVKWKMISPYLKRLSAIFALVERIAAIVRLFW
jgi:hypothetical protein